MVEKKTTITQVIIENEMIFIHQDFHMFQIKQIWVIFTRVIFVSRL